MPGAGGNHTEVVEGADARGVLQAPMASATTSGPYRGSSGARGRTILGVNASFSALRAWLRCHPVVAHNSSRIRPFSALSARLYRVAIVLVTACRWPIESPITKGLPAPTKPTR